MAELDQESRCSRLTSASNGIDNARYFIERDESPDLLQQAKHAAMWWGMFAEELAAQLLAAGHTWPEIFDALKLAGPTGALADYFRDCAERRAADLQAIQQEAHL